MAKKFIKRTILAILILAAVGVFFRGWIYRSLVTYHSVGERTNFSVTNDKLINYLDASTKNINEPNIQQIIKLGLSISSKQLNFSAGKNDIDPNQLINSKTAHCVGYAAFFTTSCNYLLEKYELSGEWTAKHQIGQLNFLGINIHKLFNSPFFKDHDFVIIKNEKTGETLAVDPTINDYLSIVFITYSE